MISDVIVSTKDYLSKCFLKIGISYFQNRLLDFRLQRLPLCATHLPIHKSQTYTRHFLQPILVCWRLRTIKHYSCNSGTVDINSLIPYFYYCLIVCVYCNSTSAILPKPLCMYARIFNPSLQEQCCMCFINRSNAANKLQLTCVVFLKTFQFKHCHAEIAYQWNCSSYLKFFFLHVDQHWWVNDWFLVNYKRNVELALMWVKGEFNYLDFRGATFWRTTLLNIAEVVNFINLRSKYRIFK